MSSFLCHFPSFFSLYVYVGGGGAVIASIQICEQAQNKGVYSMHLCTTYLRFWASRFRFRTSVSRNVDTTFDLPKREGQSCQGSCQDCSEQLRAELDTLPDVMYFLHLAEGELATQKPHLGLSSGFRAKGVGAVFGLEA